MPKVKYIKKKYYFAGTFSERFIAQGAGFKWDPQVLLWYTADPKKAFKLINYADPTTADIIRRHIAYKEESLRASKAMSSDIVVPAPIGKVYKPYQLAGVSFLRSKSNVLLADDMGLGKTIQVIGLMNIEPNIQYSLIVCPTTLKLNWLRELDAWLTTKKSIAVIEPKDKTIPTDADIVIINYELLKKHYDELHRYIWDLLVVDEAHYLKNPKASRSKEVFGEEPKVNMEPDEIALLRKPIQAEKKVCLTGTPIVNRPVELFNLVHNLDPKNFGNYWAYVQRYCGASADQRTGKCDVKGNSNLEELHDRLRATVMIRRLKADVLKELPPKIRQVIELSSQDSLTHENEFLKEHPDFYEAVRHLSFTDGVSMMEMAKARHQTALIKVPMVIDHLKNSIDSSGKVICFGWHVDVLDAIMKAFPGIAVRVVGGMNSRDKDKSVTAFQEKDKIKLFVGNFIAAGVGLTLTASSHVVFSELDYVPGTMNQCEDRAHRIGAVDSVLVQHLVLNGSIDCLIAKILVAKQAVLDVALNGKKQEERTETYV